MYSVFLIVPCATIKIVDQIDDAMMSLFIVCIAYTLLSLRSFAVPFYTYWHTVINRDDHHCHHHHYYDARNQIDKDYCRFDLCQFYLSIVIRVQPRHARHSRSGPWRAYIDSRLESIARASSNARSSRVMALEVPARCRGADSIDYLIHGARGEQIDRQ